jgi:hypothetical protein
VLRLGTNVQIRMPAKPPFFRLHYITLLIAAILTFAAIAIQFIPFKQYQFRILPLGSRFHASCNLTRSYGFPYHHDDRVQYHRFFIEDDEVELLAEVRKVSTHPKVIQSNKHLLIPPEILRSDAPLINKKLSWKDRDEYGDLFEQHLIKNALIITGIIAAISLILEILLRRYERRALQPARIATAALRLSDLHFSLQTTLVATLTFAILLWLAVRPRTSETFAVKTLTLSQTSSRSVEIERKFDIQEGWPWIHYRDRGIQSAPVTLQEHSIESKEAEQLKVGEIPHSKLAELAPAVLKKLRVELEDTGSTFPPKINYVRLTQNLLTCAALAFTLGLITELLQRRRNRKPFQTSSENPLPS